MRRLLPPALRSLILLPILVCLAACTANLYEDPAADPASTVDDEARPNFETALLFDVEAAIGARGNPYNDELFVLEDGGVGLFVEINQRPQYLHVDAHGTLRQKVDLAAALGSTDVRPRYGTPFRDGDHVLLRSRRTAYYFDMQTGAVSWRFHTEGRVIERPNGLFVYNTPCPGTQSIQGVDPAIGDLRDLVSWPFVPGHPSVSVVDIDWLDGGAGRSDQEAFAKTLYVTLSGAKDTVVNGDTSVVSFVTSTLYDAETLAPLRAVRRATSPDRYSLSFNSVAAQGPRRVLQLNDEVWAEDVRTGEVFWRKPTSQMPGISKFGPTGYHVITSDLIFGETLDGDHLGYTLHVPSGRLTPVAYPSRSYTYGNVYVVGEGHLALSESTGNTKVIDRGTSAVVRQIGPLFPARSPPAPRVTYAPASDRLVFYTGQHLYAVDGTTTGE